MGALKDLWNSERGLVGIALILACTVLLITGRLTIEQWTDYTRWIFLTYATAKTVTGTAAILKKSSDADKAKPNPLDAAVGAMIAHLAPKPDPAPAPPIPQREPTHGSALALALIAVLGIGATQVSCRPVKNVAHAGATAVVECAKADARPILSLVAELGTQAALSALNLGAIDWPGLEAAAFAQGKVTGGCALKRFVAELQAAPRPAVVGLLAPPDPGADGAAAMARLSARFDGATWDLQ